MRLGCGLGLAGLGLVSLGVLAGPAQAGDPALPRLGACGPVSGAFQLPGTDACLRLSGFVAADAGGWRSPSVSFAGLSQAAQPGARSDITRSAIGADARLNADVRIPTDYGPARVFVSVRGRHGVLSSAR